MGDNWLEIAVETGSMGPEALADKLTENGVPGLVIEDEADFLRFMEENRQSWGRVDDALIKQMKGAARIKFYVTDDDDGQALLAQYTAGLGDLKLSAVPLKEHDWATGWQKYYKPMAVGERVYIVPDWLREAPVPEGRTALYLNPGLTFGTGNHASTRMCLMGTERYVTPGGKVLDLGCGSGILSIAALLLGAQSAVGVDIDEKAVDVAYENAGMNGIGKDRYWVRAGDVLSDRALARELAQTRFELVLANIVADVIIPLSARVQTLLAPGGTFVCAGIIDTRADEVRAALEGNGLTIVEAWAQDGWAAYAARVETRR